MALWDLTDTADFDYLDHVLEVVARRAEVCSLPLMVVGAAARDLLIRGVAGVSILRGTKDVDIAVAVETWEQLAELTAPLEPVPDVPHRFVVRGVELDVVPFGAVERPDRTIVWSNDHEMTVLGFAEALATADQVVLRQSGTLSVPTLETQTVLKLVAWRDRHDIDSRDAEDLREILLAGSQGPYLDRLYDLGAAELERHDWDPTLSGSALFGRLAAGVLAEPARDVVQRILDEQVSDHAQLPAEMGPRVGSNRELIEAYRAAFVVAP